MCQGHRLLFVTNNSGKSRSAYGAKMRELGFELALQPSSILSSSYATAHFLAQQPQHVFDRRTQSVYFIGDSGIAEELQLLGIRAVSARELLGSKPVPRSQLSSMKLDPSMAAVVVGIDDQLTYATVAYAAALLNEPPESSGQQRLFIATNRDSTLPTAGRELPGAGMCVAAVEAASGRQAVNVGKPEPLMFQLASEELRLTASSCLMIGDRLDTDIEFGVRAGMDTVLVETGISQRADVMVAHNRTYPTYIVSDVNQLLADNTGNTAKQ